MINKEGRHYKTKRKIKRNSLTFITEKISNFEINKDSKNYIALYQNIKRIKYLIRDAYPFVDFKNINGVFDLIYMVYHSKYMEDILKKKAKNDKLSLIELRDYYRVIEMFFNKKYLDDNNEYIDLKNTFTVIDMINDIKETFENDIDTFVNMADKYDDIDALIEDINWYKNIQNIQFDEIRKKLRFMKYKKEKMDIKHDIDEEDIIECKYYEAREALEKALNSGERKIVHIDCMGKKYYEIYQILKDVYNDEYVLINVGL